MAFHDHFSSRAPLYARARPDYPPALFRALAAMAPARSLAWDAGTGNGQAAVGLAEHFEHVEATEPSTAQLAEARPHPRVSYRVAGAEASGLAGASVDLVTAAQAAHWFPLEQFYAEVRRVLRPRGILAVWCYGLTRITPPIDAVVDHFYHQVVGAFWPPERRHIESGFQHLPFPFREQPFPAVAMRCDWALPAFLDYLGTWSAVSRYREHHGSDPLPALAAALAGPWGAPERVRPVTWPLGGRVGTPA